MNRFLQSAKPKRRKYIYKSNLPKPYLPQRYRVRSQNKRLKYAANNISKKTQQIVVSNIEQRVISTLNRDNIPYSHLVFSKHVKEENIRKHVTDCYISVNTILKLGQLNSQQRKKCSFALPTPNHPRKTLFIDLDETLIHASTTAENLFTHSLIIQCMGIEKEIQFNIRPYCFEFLKSISELYEIYIFTASHQTYAKAMMNFLNKPYKSISGCLSRNHCLRTIAGRYIKHIGCISNRDISRMVLIDNIVLSFGELLSNGIPILEFTQDVNDEELKHLESYLIELEKVDDVRQSNEAKFQLKYIVNINPNELFISQQMID